LLSKKSNQFRQPLYGDLVNWKTAQWDVTNMEMYDTDYNSICSTSDLGLVIFPGNWNYSAANTLCENVKGGMVTLYNQSDQDTIINLLNKSSTCREIGESISLSSINNVLQLNIIEGVSGRAWIGWWDVPNEGTYESIIEHDVLLQPDGFHPWSPGEPNGDTLENCVELTLSGDWNDARCSKTRCTACNMKETPIFNMRGLCIGSSFDADYGWTGETSEDSEKYSFRGFSKSIVVWKPTKMEWRLILYSSPNIYATCNETGSEGYPFGTLRWYFFNDTCPRIGETETVADNIYKLDISFTACSDDEFNCRDGTW
jgi:hypothetical protein